MTSWVVALEMCNSTDWLIGQSTGYLHQTKNSKEWLIISCCWKSSHHPACCRVCMFGCSGVLARQNSKMRWEFFLSRSTPGSLPDGLFHFCSSALSVFGPCTCGNGGCVCMHHGSLGSCLLLLLDLCASPWLFQFIHTCKVGIWVCWMFSSCLSVCLAKSLQTSSFLLFPWDLVFLQSVGHSVLRRRRILFLCQPIFGHHWNVSQTISWSPIGCFWCVFCHRQTCCLVCCCSPLASPLTVAWFWLQTLAPHLAIAWWICTVKWN